MRPVPTPALVLGLCGLIPFFGAAMLIWVNVPIDSWLPEWFLRGQSVKEICTVALGAYGAVILSFLGGVRWGNLLFDNASLIRWLPLTLSVLPSLVAWLALLLAPVPMLIVLSFGFCLQLALDTAATSRGELPEWFLRLRMILTTGAVVSLIIGLFGLVF